METANPLELSDTQNQSARKPTLPLLLAALFSFLVFSGTLYLCHCKYLIFDYSHFDLLDHMLYNGTFASEGFSGLYQQHPFYLFALLMEGGNLSGMAAMMVYKSAYSLFVLQSFFLGISLFLGFLLIRKICNNDWAALIGIVVVGLNPYVWMYFTSGFRPALTGVPLYLLFLYFIQKEKPKLAVAAIICFALCKVTLAFSTAFLGLLLWLIPPKKKIGLAIFLISIVIFIALVAASSMVSGQSDFAVSAELLHINAYGDTVQEAIRTILTSPLFLLKQIFSQINMVHILLLGSFLFLPLFAGRFFWGGLPDFLLILISTTSLAQGGYHAQLHPAYFHPLLMLHNNHIFITGILIGAFCVGFANCFKRLRKGNLSRHWKTAFLAFVLVAGLAVRMFWPVLIGGPLPGNIHYDKRYYSQSQHDRLGREIAQTIPGNASVRSQWNLYSKGVTERKSFRTFEWNLNEVIEDYVFVDLYSFEYLISRQNYLNAVKDLLKREDYQVARFEDGYLLVEKGSRDERSDQVLQYISDHKSLLLKNLYRPYRDRRLQEPQVGRDVYSASQLIRN